MKSLATRLCGGLLLFFHCLSASAALPPGISGIWYNPQQSGHGLTISVHSPNEALVFWYTGDIAGNPLLLYTEMHADETLLHDDSLLRGDALSSRGIRFGTFNPADNQLTRWGGIELAVVACDRLILRYDANGPAGGPAYGRGEIEMRKLVGVDETSCVESRLAAGLYQSLRLSGSFPFIGSAGLSQYFDALVSADGSVWLSFDRGLKSQSTVVRLDPIPRSEPSNDGGVYSGVAHRQPPPFTDFTSTPSFEDPQTGDPIELSLLPESSRRGYYASLAGFGPDQDYLSFDLTPFGMGDVSAYRRDVSLSALRGRYRQTAPGYIGISYIRIVRVGGDGRFEGDEGSCRFSGQLRKTISPSIEFEAVTVLTGCGERDGEYTGKAWVSRFDTAGTGVLRLTAIRNSGTPLALLFHVDRLSD